MINEDPLPRPWRGTIQGTPVLRNSKQTAHERAVFETFLEAWPSFATQLDSREAFRPATEDFPDVQALTADGRRQDFELGEWLDEHQMRLAKQKERLRVDLKQALADCERPTNCSFSRVHLEVKDETRFIIKDSKSFLEEFRHLADEVNRSCFSSPGMSSIGQYLAEFSKYPTLKRYLESAHFWPKQSPQEEILGAALEKASCDPEIAASLLRAHEELLAYLRASGLLPTIRPSDRWICFPVDGAAFSSESALRSLAAIIEKKLIAYDTTSCRDVSLIVYYDEAVLYNTPYSDLRFRTFADLAREGARCIFQLISDRHCPFSHIYLLKALRPHPEVFQIWPTLATLQ